MTIFLVPDELFSPQPTLLPHLKNQLDYVSMTLATHYFFLDV